MLIGRPVRPRHARRTRQRGPRHPETSMEQPAPGETAAVPTWDEIVEQPLRPRLPPRLPPDRQPPRRRGPHPGGLRPGLPLAATPTPPAPSRAGCTGSPPTSSSTRPAASSGSASTRSPTSAPAGFASTAPGARRGVRSTAPSTTTSSARSPRCPRTSAPPSCSATSRASPTRRSRRSSAPSSAPSAPASTAAAPSCAARSRTGRRRPAGSATPARSPTATRRPHPSAWRGLVIGHLGPRVSALLDGQLDAVEEERAWAHVHACHALPRPRRARGLGQDPAGRARPHLVTDPAPAPSGLKGALLLAPMLPPGDTCLLADSRHRPRAASVAVGGGAVGMAVLGLLLVGAAPASAPATDRRAPVTSLVGPRSAGLLQRSGGRRHRRAAARSTPAGGRFTASVTIRGVTERIPEPDEPWAPDRDTEPTQPLSGSGSDPGDAWVPPESAPAEPAAAEPTYADATARRPASPSLPPMNRRLRRRPTYRAAGLWPARRRQREPAAWGTAPMHVAPGGRPVVADRGAARWRRGSRRPSAGVAVAGGRLAGARRRAVRRCRRRSGLRPARPARAPSRLGRRHRPGPPLPADNGSVAAVAQQLLPSTVQILADSTASDGGATGSGFVLDRAGPRRHQQPRRRRRRRRTTARSRSSTRTATATTPRWSAAARSTTSPCSTPDEAKGLQPAALGASQALRVGERRRRDRLAARA